jgi:hypothetical protein
MPIAPPPPALCGRWLHSHEEDEGDAQVFRPEGHPLPPSRGRGCLDLRRDGSLLESRPGADDRPTAARGRWTLTGDRLKLFRDASAQRPDRELEIVSLAADRLVVRRAGKPQRAPGPG